MGITICISNVAIVLILLGYLIYNGAQYYDQGSQNGNFLNSKNLFNSAPEFCFTFHFQIYFLIVLQYLGHRKKIRNSYIVATATNLSVFTFCILFAAFSLSTKIVFKEFRDAILQPFNLEANKILVNVLLLWIMCL